MARIRLNEQMTKSASPSIKQDAPASGFEDPLTAALQADEFAELTTADIEANARTQQFVDTLSREDRSKFYSMIGNDKFFKMFGAYAQKQSPPAPNVGDEDQSSPASDNLAGNEDSTGGGGIRYRGATDAEKARLYDGFIADQIQHDKEKKYSSRKIPSFQNKWGLQISPAVRSEQELGVVKVILCKQD
jgi:hypothetical protein